jgi:ABC-2 type transport system permease protein
MSIYTRWFRRFFTFIVPLAFVNYFPSLYLMDKPDPLGLSPVFQLVAPLVGPLFLALSLLFWRIGVQHYQSTGT